MGRQRKHSNSSALLNRYRQNPCKIAYGDGILPHILANDLPEFPSAALSSIDVATATPHSSALQNENSFYVIMLKMNVPVH